MMKKTNLEWPASALRPIELKLRRLVSKLARACVRLAEPDKQMAVHLLVEFCSRKTRASHRYAWLKADIERCYLQLQPISQKIANDFRSWASQYRETEYQFRLAYRSRIAELVRRARSGKH